MRAVAAGREIPVNVAGSSKFGRYPKISIEKTYNMLESDGWLINMAGYQKVYQPLDFAEGRGAFVSTRGNFSILVISANVYRINPGLGAVKIGQLESTVGAVFMDENLSNQICIVDGVNAYIYNWSQPAQVVKQADAFIGTSLLPNYVCFHNTFFLIGNAIRTGDGAKWFVYQPVVGDPLAIEKFDEAALQIKPDFAIAIERIPSQADNVLVFGRSVCEIQTFISQLSTPTYRRNSSVSVDYGCISVDTIATNEEYIMWVGVNATSKPVIMKFSGQTAKPVSTDGIDYLLGSIKQPQKSMATFVRQDGRLLYQLTFYHTNSMDPTNDDNITLVYDVEADKFYHGSDQNLNFHPAREAIYFDKKNYFLSLTNGALYLWDTDITQIIEDIPDTSEPPAPIDPRLVFDMQCIRICETIRAPKNTPFSVNTFTFTIDMGNDETPGTQDCIIIMITEDDIRIFSEIPSDYVQVVPEDGGIEDCQETPYRGRIDLAQSKDGGETFSNYVPRYMNVLGKRKNILKWERMGWCNEWTPKLRFWISGRKVASGGVLDVIAAGGEQ